MSTQAEALALVGNAEVQYPTCPCCYAECGWEDGPTCAPCGLYWAEDLTSPQYLDDQLEPCDRPGRDEPTSHHGYLIRYARCPLPTGHASAHHHPYEIERQER